MLRPSYSDLLEVIDKNGDAGDVAGSRYSIVIAAAKRARQLVDHDSAMVAHGKDTKPVSIAVNEIFNEKLKIVEDGDICCGEAYEALLQAQSEMEEASEATETEAVEEAVVEE